MKLSKQALMAVTTAIVTMGMGMSLSVPALANTEIAGVMPISAVLKTSAGGITMEQAILKAKSVINIPAEYSEFSQAQYEDHYRGQPINAWAFTWSSPDDNGDSITCSVDELGNICYITKSSGNTKTTINDSSKYLAAVPYQTAKATADAFLKKVLPTEVAGKMIFDKDAYNYNASFRFTYVYHNSAVSVPSLKVTVFIDPQTGELSQYNGFEAGTTIPSAFADKSGVLTRTAAKEAFLKQIGLNLVYVPSYDSKTDAYTVKSVYRLDGSYNVAIDAKSGKRVRMEEPYGFAAGEGAKMSGFDNIAATSTAGNMLTPKEREVVDKIASLMTSEQATAKVRATMPSYTELSGVPSSTSLKKLAGQEQYIWNLNYANASASVDAKTGEIISFFSYTENKGTAANPINEKQAQVIAEDFIKKVSPDKFKATKIDTDLMSGSATGNYGADDEYYFRYSRYENGIAVSNNGINMTVRNDGTIVSLRTSWLEDISFPSIEDVVSTSEAFDKLESVVPFDMSYRFGYDIKDMALNYSFDDSEVYNIVIDADSGKPLNYYGLLPYQKKVAPSGYSDLSGHPIERTVNTLIENGYFMTTSDGKFNPATQTTQVNMIKYLFASNYLNYLDNEDIYKELAYMEILPVSEQNYNKVMTQLDAAKIAVRFLGLEKAARMSSVYMPISGVPTNMLGYVSVCTGLGVFDAKTFSPDAKMTNADTATFILNLLRASDR